MFPPVISETDEVENASEMPEDNHTFKIADALQAYDNFDLLYSNGDGSVSFLQMYIYQMSTCNDDPWLALPHSGVQDHAYAGDPEQWEHRRHHVEASRGRERLVTKVRHTTLRRA